MNRIRNEKGFLYPITLCFLLFFTTMFLVSMEHFLTMKKTAIETENILKVETHLLRTVQLMERRLAEDESLPLSGLLQLSDFDAEYSLEMLTESIWQIHIELQKEGETVFKGYFYYDKDLQKIFKWVER